MLRQFILTTLSVLLLYGVYGQCTSSEYYLISEETVPNEYQLLFGSSTGSSSAVRVKSATLTLSWSSGLEQIFSYANLDVSTFPVDGYALLSTPLELPTTGCGFVEATFSYYVSGCPGPPLVLSQTIFYGDPLLGSITVSNNGCGSMSFSANPDLTTLGIGSPLWGFGDGSHSTQVAPSHTYSGNGTYVVTLQDAENLSVCPYYIEVVVDDFPSSGYTWMGSCTTTTVDFQAPGGLTYSWDFGDGSSSSAQNPSHTYTVAGEYPVTLTVSNGSCSSSSSQYVQAGALVPEFGFSDLCETSAFTPSTLPEWADSYSWDFNDDQVEDAQGYLISHTFLTDFSSSTYNDFDVTLSVTYGSCTASHTETIRVYQLIEAGYTYTTTGSCSYDEYTFTPEDVVAGPSYYWNFSEPLSQLNQTGAPVNHTFSNPGSYLVKLKVTNGACVQETAQTIVVGETLEVGIVSDAPYVCGTGSVTLTAVPGNELSGSTYAYEWFDDNQVSIGTGQTLVVDSSGTYSVTVTDLTCNHTATASLSVPFLPLPQTGSGTVNNAVSCPGAPDGSLVFDLPVELITAGYDFNSSSGTYDEQTSTLSGLSEGTTIYTISYTEYPLCSYTGYAVIEYDGPTLEVTTLATDCDAPTGELLVSASDQSSVSNISWENALNPQITGSNTTGLEAGIYNVTGTVNGCELTSYNHQIGTVYISVSHTLGYACSELGGSVELSAQSTNGSESYAYTLNGNTQTGSTATFNNLAIGSYTVEVEGQNSGCTQSYGFEIYAATGLSVGIDQGDINCQTLTDGTLEAIVTGGSGSYSYEWSDLPNHDSPLRDSIEAETLYTVTVTDLQTGCSVQQSTEIEDPKIWSIAGLTTQGCEVTVGLTTTNNGLLDTMILNGGFTVVWTQGTEQGGTFTPNGYTYSSGLETNNLPEGTYLVTVTDPNGCSEEYTYLEMTPNVVAALSFSFVFGDVVFEEEPENPKDDPDAALAENLTEAADAMLEQLSSCMNLQSGIAQANYQQHCQSLEYFQDNMTLRYTLSHEQYMLYYYDRAGNLTKTVPPEGVEFLSTTDIAQTKAYRKSGQVSDEPSEWVPDHRLATTYNYNALGQLKSQQTPDGGEAQFIYDGLQRLRFSQNARQAQDGTFSYMKYDALGRVYEAGESNEAASGIDFGNVFASVNQLLANDASFPQSGTHVLSQVVRTNYSTVTSVDYYGEGQKYLQNRVSYITRDEDGDDQTTEDRYTTYYSYDVHGNVQWLVQEDPIIGRNYVKYYYDLISGNVLEVAYNEHRKDRFFHRYGYDADNRLEYVETSRDGELWDRDGEYMYYDHGSLKALKIGEDRIQEVDYTYTIQGWIKSINNPNAVLSQTTSSSELIGSGITHSSLSDAFGMSLGYHQGDFTRNDVGTVNENLSAGNLYGPNDLFNGNISSWNWKTATGDGLTSISMTMAYRYDNLQRIKSMNSYTYDNGSQLLTASNNFNTAYSFDRNGNLLTLARNDDEGNVMDELDYTYMNTSGTPISNEPVYEKRTTNKLYSVTDNGTYSPGSNTDLLGTHAYTYDEIGNLIQDVGQENLNGEIWDVTLNIDWTVDQKVSQISKTRSYNGTTVQEVSKFHYDPMGVRIGKTTVADLSDPLLTATYTRYVTDATGNPMGTYEIRITEGDGFDHQAELWLIEHPIYGAQRLGIDAEEQLLQTWQFNGNNIGQYNSNGTQVLSELTNWITPLLKTIEATDATLCQCEIRHTYFSYDQPSDSYSMQDGGEAVSYYGKTSNGVTVGETTEGVLEVYATVAEHYLGDQTVSLVFNTDNELIKGVETLETPYAGVKPVIAREPSQSPGGYQLFTLNEERHPVMHTLNMQAQGWGALGEQKGEISSGNTVLDTEYEYGSHMTLLEDQLNQRNLLYMMRYVPAADTEACLGEVELVVFEITPFGVSSPIYMSRVESSDSLGEGELQLSKDATQLVYYNHLQNIGGFAHRMVELDVFGLDGSRTAVTTLTPIVRNDDYAGNYGKGSADFTTISDLYYSQNGIYEQNNPSGTQDGSEKQVLYYNMTTQTYEYTTPEGEYQYMEVRRGKTQMMYVPTEAEAASYMEWVNTGSFSTLLPTQPLQADYVSVSHLPVQPHTVIAAAQETTLTRTIGYKHYELSDHLGNVRYVIGDVRIYQSITVQNTDEFTVVTTDQQIAWSDYYPYGMLMPERHVQNEVYRYGFNGYEADIEVKGNGNSYTTEFRQYDPRVGKWLTLDPVFKPHESPYAWNGNNPVWFIDPNGADSIKAPNGKMKFLSGTLDGYDGNRLVKSVNGDKTEYYSWNDDSKKYVLDENGKTKWDIWHTADYLSKLMVKLDNFGKNYPLSTAPIKLNLWAMKKATSQLIDYENPGWIDLSMMYMYELGPENITISGNDKSTIKDLKQHAGVNKVRWEAFQGWMKGGNKSSEYSDSWGYYLNTFKKNLTTDWVWLEVFLGSYSTKVQVTTSGDIYSFTFTVQNTSSVESLTRFRRENGVDVGILESRERGTGWGLGGNFYQTFTWTERYTMKNGKFVPYKP